MAAKVFTFHIVYEGLEEKIWRNIAVSSNYRLDQLGYAVLAAFDTMAYHLFEFHYKDGRFEIPGEDAANAKLVSSTVTLKMGVCPECGRTYVAGGLTKTQIRYTESNPYEKNRKQLEGSVLAGANIDASA